MPTNQEDTTHTPYITWLTLSRNPLRNNGLAVGCFVDIEVSFDNTSYECNAVQGVDNRNCKWIKELL